MTLQYDLKEADFITHQLYIASKSDRIRKRQLEIRITFTLIYLGMAALFFMQKSTITGGIMIAIAVLWFIIYPVWKRSLYVKHYTRFVKENYTERINKTTTVEISDDFIIARDPENESKLSTGGIEGIYEIPTLILVRLKIGNALIIPKERIPNLDVLIARLKDLARHLEINYQVEHNWKWK